MTGCNKSLFTDLLCTFSCITCLCFILTGIFGSGIWHTMQSETHPELVGLIRQLPVFLIEAKSKNTVKCYSASYSRWVNWCQKFNLCPLPASEKYVALYVLSLVNSGCSKSTIDQALYGIAWAHDLSSCTNPCNSRFVHLARNAAYRTVGRPIVKKEPVLPSHLDELVKRFGHSNAKLDDLRVVTMCLLAYAGFLRFSELSALKRNNFKFFENYVQVFIESSKTDRFREGDSITIARSDLNTCPVSMLLRYFQAAKVPNDSEEFVFRSIQFYKSTNSYALKGTAPLSYTRTREIMLQKFKQIGLDPKLFGVHSLRAGGATAAARFGVSERLFKRHGRWKSETAKDGYVKDGLNERLSVSANIGI